MKHLLRQLPAISELQQAPEFTRLITERSIAKEKGTEWLQEAVAEVRTEILSTTLHIGDVSLRDYIFQLIEKRVHRHQSYNLRRVINGTGTVLHTNFGRARLSEQAIERVVQTAASYSNLEYDLDQGKRGSRHDLIDDLVREATGAEAAMVVNNNAAAVYLVLKALAKGKKVIVSRGELVEIGGSFRVSSIMEESGATLVEVGTTNKTHLYDYEQAITEDTAMVMKVHTSNFKVIGFTKEVSVEQLHPVAKENNVIVYEDLGSGALYDLRLHQIGNEPAVAEALKKGADIVTFSGDKLLGGPQAGIIAGKKELIAKLKKHQLARVLRVDKMTLAALEATLKEYMNKETVVEKLPTLKAILLSKKEVNERIQTFLAALPSWWQTDVRPSFSQVGGGTMPDVELPTSVLLLRHPTVKAQALHDFLRKGDPAVVTRIMEDHIALDFRTIEPKEFDAILFRLSEVERGNDV